MRILFLCYANSARSQMAEGLARNFFGEDAHVESAGLIRSKVHPLAIDVMAEVGINIRAQTSKAIDDLPGGPEARFDIITTLCDEGVCPTWLKGEKMIHHPIANPTVGRTENEQRARFRTARDQIRKFIVDEIKPLMKTTVLFLSVWMGTITLKAYADKAADCALDPATRTPVDMIINEENHTRICVLNLVCGKSKEAVYCEPVTPKTCPPVEACLGKALPLKTDLSHSTAPKGTDLPQGKDAAKKDGSVKVEYIDPPAVVSDPASSGTRGGGSTCVGDAQFTVFTRKGAKVGTAPVVGRSANGGMGCPSADALARDPKVRFMTNDGRPPQIDGETSPINRNRAERAAAKSRPSPPSDSKSGQGPKAKEGK